MPFLTLNGIPVPVVEGRRRQVSIGSDSRAFGGAYRLGRRGVRQEWEFRTGPLATAEATALRGLVSGDGHALSFDVDSFTSRGLGPVSAAGIISQGARFGGGLVLPVGASCSWGMQLGSNWTTLHHTYNAALRAWSHVINRSDGARWTQGVLGGSAGGLLVSSGALSLTGAVGLTNFDDAVGLPFKVPDEWVGAVFGWHSTRAWSALPFLTAGGSFAPAEVRVLGEVRDGEFVDFVQDGERLVGERFDFTLREV